MAYRSALFAKDIASGRGVAASRVRSEFGQGDMVLAQEAVELGMADRVGTMGETLRRLGVGWPTTEVRAEADDGEPGVEADADVEKVAQRRRLALLR